MSQIEHQLRTVLHGSHDPYFMCQLADVQLKNIVHNRVDFVPASKVFVKSINEQIRTKYGYLERDGVGQGKASSSTSNSTDLDDFNPETKPKHVLFNPNELIPEFKPPILAISKLIIRSFINNI